MSEEIPLNDGKILENQPVRDEKGRIVSGVLNPNGKPKGTKHLSTKLFDALQQLDPNSNKSYADLLVKRILNDAIVKGNTTLINLVMSYIDGAPQQGIDLTTNGESISQPSDKVMEMIREVSDKLKQQKTQ